MLGFLIAPMLRTGDSMERFVTAEIAQTRAAMGERVGNGVVSFANGLFENTPLKGVMVAANKASLTDKERQLSIKVAGVGGAVMADLFNSYMSGLVLQSYVVAMRLAIVMIIRRLDATKRQDGRVRHYASRYLHAGGNDRDSHCRDASRLPRDAIHDVSAACASVGCMRCTPSFGFDLELAANLRAMTR